MHESPLSARLCGWTEDYPYAYSSGTSSAHFVAALDQHVRVSGDLALARELWPTVERALAFCANACDERGLLASEKLSGPTRAAGGQTSRSEMSAQGAWLSALQGAVRMAQALGRDATRFMELLMRAVDGFESFWSEQHRRYGSALLTDGERRDELDPCVAEALARGFGQPARAWATLQALERPDLALARGALRFSIDPSLDERQAAVRGGAGPCVASAVALAHFAHGNGVAGPQALLARARLIHRAGLGLLAQAPEPDGAPAAPSVAPQRLAAAAGLLESALAGLFGLEIDASKRQLVLRPSLPHAWDEARLENLRVGETRLDLGFYRRRAEGETRVGVTIEHHEGPSIQVAYAPILPPLSTALDGPIFVHQSGAVVPRRPRRVQSGGLALEARVLEGPSLALPAEGDPGAPRLIGQDVQGDLVRWTLTGLAGTSAELAFHSDRPVELAGGALEDGVLRVEFGPGAKDEWKTLPVRARVR
jgi:hypothetical protein